MKDYKSLSHTRWDCNYHIVLIPKKRKKVDFDTHGCYQAIAARGGKATTIALC